MAEDFTVQTAEIPPSKEPISVARLEYEMLAGSPYRYTSDDAIYETKPDSGKTAAMRTIDNERRSKSFAAIYDLLHSHEDPEKAAEALSVLCGTRTS